MVEKPVRGKKVGRVNQKAKIVEESREHIFRHGILCSDTEF